MIVQSRNRIPQLLIMLHSNAYNIVLSFIYRSYSSIAQASAYLTPQYIYATPPLIIKAFCFASYICTAVSNNFIISVTGYAAVTYSTDIH